MAKFIRTPVKGMQDFLPEDMELRSHVLAMIRDIYRRYGFNEIETPVMEHIENLTGKQGGENEKLIFKVLKRGAELERGLQSGELADSGLRYDLTMPLSRYYACNKNSLPTPFKALQIGNVFRADRPQKGRFRQFTQCDIDILGDETIMAEIELIGATTAALTAILKEVNLSGITVHVNDRRVLRAMAENAGFDPENLDEVFIILDKMDKIGPDGVKEELLAAGYPEAAVSTYAEYLKLIGPETDPAAFIRETCGDKLDAVTAEDLLTVLRSAEEIADPSVTIKFDPTLVRGMGYYTGTIFEVSIDSFNSSIAGGGRYDKMVGNFAGADTPACGFSIGFERIVTILKENGWKNPEVQEKKAFLIDKNAGNEKLLEVFRRAAEMRKSGTIVSVERLRKNAKFQVESLENSGYTEIKKVYSDTEL